MLDPPSAGPDISHLDYYEAVMYNNVIALNLADGSTRPFGIEYQKTADVIAKNCHGNEDTVIKGTVLIPCSSLETAEMISGSACISPSGTAFTLKQPMQDHMHLERGKKFVSCV